MVKYEGKAATKIFKFFHPLYLFIFFFFCGIFSERDFVQVRFFSERDLGPDKIFAVEFCPDTTVIITIANLRLVCPYLFDFGVFFFSFQFLLFNGDEGRFMFKRLSFFFFHCISDKPPSNDFVTHPERRTSTNFRPYVVVVPLPRFCGAHGGGGVFGRPKILWSVGSKTRFSSDVFRARLWHTTYSVYLKNP